ncbi:MAG: hypothetical protein HY902_03915 [Deltaproteobacteria bacterium]|nr:hypothetical protein [Deltaproteobacteria bacterium]
MVACEGSTWQLVVACPAGQYCIEIVSGPTIQGSCKGTATGGQDAGSDLGGGEDASGQTDAEAPPDTVAEDIAVDDTPEPSDTVEQDTAVAPDADTATADLVDPSAVCGNGVCEIGENTLNCLGDCPNPKCGNGVCEAGESAASCTKDCANQCPGGTACVCAGDADCTIGVCHTSGSNKKTCPQECIDVCPTDWTCTEVQNIKGDYVNVCVSKAGYVCGDGKCSSKETTASCPKDCKNVAVCGNGTCENGETTALCPKDCPSTLPGCGNGTCSITENFKSCPADCAVNTAGCKGRCGLTAVDASGNLCYCDKLCKSSGDCCADYATYCTCTPSCTGKKCGPDGCGGNCGVCPTGSQCDNGTGQCQVTPKCGNGVCESSETATTCSSDCKTHPCDGFCGKQNTALGCWCDAECMNGGDCCTAAGGKGATCAGSTCTACQ